MKTLFIIITLFCISVIVISLSSQAYAIPYIPSSARYFNSEIVLIGKVVSSTPFSPTDTKYEIKVEQYLKNPQSKDTMTVIASGTNKSIGMTADTVFNVGQRVFLYLKQDQGNYIVWWYSHPTDFLCDPAPTAADLNSTNISGAGLDYEPLHVGASKSNSHLYAPNQPIIISYDAWNNQFTTKTFDVVFQVKNQTGQIIFNDTKQVKLKPCIGHQIVNSTFTPKVGGTYEADVIFDNSLTGFTVQIPRPSGIEEVFLTLDKESYVPGDLMLIRGQVFLNATNVTISLEKNHKSPVITKDFPISKNGTFYANFTIPFDASAKSWTLATTVGGGTLREDFHFKSDSVLPLDQFWSGIAAKDIQCKKELQLVIKSEDGSPACVRPDTAYILIHNGWAKEIVTNTSTESSALNKTTANELKIDLSNQTYVTGYPVTASLDFITHDPDCQLPSILVKNLSTNMSVYGPVLLWNYTNTQCSNSTRVSFYAGLENNQLITNTERYQILATIYGKQYKQEFTVVPSEYSGKNITAQSILPGSDPWLSCPAIPGTRTSETIRGASGFDGVYHRYLTDSSPSYEVDDYFLKPGHTGKITIEIHPGSAFPVGDNLAEGELILNKDSHSGNFAHPGVNTIYEPSVAIAGPNGSATLSLVVSVMQNATFGTYWMYLPPGGCGGGDLVFLTIGDQPIAQPPDLIGYGMPVDFSFSESPILTADVINFGIHTFDKCSLTYEHDNKTLLTENFDEIPPGFLYRYHFDSNPVNGDKVTFECATPHIVKTYSPD